ncbi:MAG TPA: hypothetical protein VHL59_11225, partial [Thermoanaerobaculia bacterium]|nr:hypothetical protein [Thermoanaerobaculia bacterium]
MLAFVLFALCSLPMLALEYPCADNETECGGIYEGDEETGGDGTGASIKGEWVGGRFNTCTAYAAFNQKCYAALPNPKDSSKKSCQAVTYDAHCACHTGTFEVEG